MILHHSLDACAEELVTLPFGDAVGDHFGPYARDAVSNEIRLDGKYVFYGTEQRSLYVSEFKLACMYFKSVCGILCL